MFASAVDIGEAYDVGRKAVEIAVNDGSGWMATILRKPGDGYAVYYDKVPLRVVANSFRLLPRGWLAPGGLDVTDDFIRYAAPLIGEEWPPVALEGGRQRFARLDLRFVDKRCREYVPVRVRAAGPR
jgi:6-phosphofructokinase 1